ncbi:MAG: hypothetical protein DRQ78_06400 [Epsilonproteobacteria bacterium]|nr:MAG: hypothetical protein DRQ78_06400 [Campylobacterota bacterium]
MIPLNIEDPIVLRRTLEEIEEVIPKLDASAQTVDKIEEGADLTTVTAKLNEVIGSIDLIISSLNK